MMRYVILFLYLSLLLGACENTKHTIGVSGKPLSTKMDESVKFNYKITFGKIRPKEDDDD